MSWCALIWMSIRWLACIVVQKTLMRSVWVGPALSSLWKTFVKSRAMWHFKRKWSIIPICAFQCSGLPPISFQNPPTKRADRAITARPIAIAITIQRPEDAAHPWLRGARMPPLRPEFPLPSPTRTHEYYRGFIYRLLYTNNSQHTGPITDGGP